MSEDELSIALQLLRVIKGWNQADLARASRVHNTSVSEYERGKTIPELRTLHRLVGAMGYPLSALDQPYAYIETVRTHSLLTVAPAPALSAQDPGGGEPRFSRQQLVDNSAALGWEIEQFVDFGRVCTRGARIVLALVDRALRSQPPSRDLDIRH
jgi:transcriptional regulator with XRE-family HTH domain